MKHLKRFNEAAKVEKTSKKDEIEDFIGKNKKNKTPNPISHNIFAPGQC